MGQPGFFDLDERYRGLDAKKDPLVFLNEVVPWEDFRARLSAVWRKPDEELMLGSLGLPLPGEAALITASIYAGATHDLTLTGIIAAAVTGAVVGDNIGFWIGEKVGYRLLIRVGPSLGITPTKVKLGQYLFMRHGGKVVFFGRFVAVLRVLAAFLAGAN